MVSREKQLKRLKKDAMRLWTDQQELLGRANVMARDALPHAQYFARGLGPSAAALYSSRLLPYAGRSTQAGLAASRFAAGTARDAFYGTVLPALTSAAAAAVTLADEASTRLGFTDPGTKQAAKTAAGAATKATKVTQGSRAAKGLKLAAAAKAAGGARKAASTAPAKGGPGVGGTVGLTVGAVALAGIGYAVWQTLRADDDLWVADDEPETTPTSDAPTA